MKTIALQKKVEHLIVGGTGEVTHDFTVTTTQAMVDKLVKAPLPQKLPPPFIKQNMNGNKSVTIAPKFN